MDNARGIRMMLRMIFRHLFNKKYVRYRIEWAVFIPVSGKTDQGSGIRRFERDPQIAITVFPKNEHPKVTYRKVIDMLYVSWLHSHQKDQNGHIRVSGYKDKENSVSDLLTWDSETTFPVSPKDWENWEASQHLKG